MSDLSFSLAMTPEARPARFRLAWIYACTPDDAVRSGEAALKLLSPLLDSDAAAEAEAEEDEFIGGENGVFELTAKSKDTPLSLRQTEAIAAVRAETGDFKLAIESQQTALRLAETPEEIREARERLTLYEAGKPYRLPVKQR
jgi:hypothetical protein